MGGEDGFAGFGFQNDVLRSDDGGAVSWYLVLKHAPWRARAGHKAFVVNDDEIWLVGGGLRTLARKLFNDVWVSKDFGVTWEERTSSAEWSPRAGMEIAVLEEGKQVLLMGGDHDVPVFSSNGPNFNDVWSSVDGGRLGLRWEKLGGRKEPVRNAFGRPGLFIV